MACVRCADSWNGATEVKRWRILRDPTNPPVSVVHEEDRTQFEQWLAVPEGRERCEYYWAIALQEDGRELRRSNIVKSRACEETSMAMARAPSSAMARSTRKSSEASSVVRGPPLSRSPT